MKVKFVPQNIELEIRANQTVKNLADENGIFIKSVCNGLPSCAECRVKVIEGEHNVLPPATKELNLIGNGYFIDQRRLSCQLLCFGDITVDLTEQVEKQKSAGPRRPQGAKRGELEVSHAVTGNLIEQDQELKNLAQDPQPEPEASKRGSESRPAQNNRPRQGEGSRRDNGGRRGSRRRGGGTPRSKS